jgi:hypothetical protein
MYFSDIGIRLKKGDLILINQGILIDRYMATSPTYAIYYSEYKEYYVKVFLNGKIKTLSKVLISTI